MALPAETNPEFADYAHPERLVSTDWLAQHLGEPGLVVVESDEDVLLYDTGHIPGAVKIDWHLDLNDPVTRDYVDGAGFAALMARAGIDRDSTVVIYGDRNNWWAAYALWVFTLFGHPDVRLLDGGRAKWLAEGRDSTTEVPEPDVANYPVVERSDEEIRAFKDDVVAHLGQPLIDVRSPAEYTGERTHMPEYPEEGALRGGHIPGAKSVPWARAAAEDGTFKRRPDLEAIYQQEQGLSPDDDVIAYCRIGERSSHTWFVLHHLLGFDRVRNYDGSWTEWGNAVRVPIVKGAEPGVGGSVRLTARRPADLPPALAEIVDDFTALSVRDRLQLLLDFSRELPDLPPRIAEHPELLEPVPECQSPLFLDHRDRPPDKRIPTCTCTSPPRRRHPPPAASPASCTKDSTGCPPRPSSPYPTTCRTGSAWPRR